MYILFIFYKLINKIIINQVISYWPSYGSSVGCIGPRLKGQYSRPRTRNWANTFGRGPIQPTEDQ